MMDQQQLQKLIEKYQKGTATAAEKKAVEAFFETYRKEGEAWPYEVMGDKDQVREELLAGIYERTGKKVVSVPVWQHSAFRIAATLLLLIAVGYGVTVLQKEPKVNTEIAFDLAPGGDKAILQLADGSMVELDSAGSARIPQQATAVISNGKGQLAYTIVGTSSEAPYNKIITPRGGQYQVTLADGSRIWLNASSSLRYPVVFNGRERTVDLTGEAYFEVARNEAKPFKVNILPSPEGGGLEGAQVQVLGTRFNVMAYGEEASIKTTLLEGAVKINRGDKSEKLLPGQQLQLTKAGYATLLKEADVEEAVAWKNGSFRFDETDLKTIMRQVSRWYDVDVVYEDDVADLDFVAIVPRTANASGILRPIELTGAVHFEIGNQTITVRKGKKKS